MTNREEQKGLRRRGFLGMFAGATAATATAAVVGAGAVNEAQAQETEDEMRKARYQETDHVKAFYRTNRY
ncbi:formate dehydrogenase [Pararhizobium haloflavum]|uniref:formate dehydrogenase n=1 Tax=Pararhizobium haloflavum TaxID=2037914 RepID=UPI001FDF9625|nr:formate dehydrogenase [Pararhizobium haloflavum]